MEKYIDKLQRVCILLNIPYRLLSVMESEKLITETLSKFKVSKKFGHLAINYDSVTLPVDVYEFKYSDYLENEKVYMFFDQGNHNKNSVLELDSAKNVCYLMENSYGIEYFLTNKNCTFLIAVNWYVIEGAGAAKKWMHKMVNENYDYDSQLET